MRYKTLALSECSANTQIAYQLSNKLADALGPEYRLDVRHCGSNSECLKSLNSYTRASRRGGGPRDKPGTVVALIDYEIETGARRYVENFIRDNECECTPPNRGLTCCRCRGGRVLLVLFEGGPEEVLERLGYRLSPVDRQVLKSRPERRPKLINALVEHVVSVCIPYLFLP